MKTPIAKKARAKKGTVTVRIERTDRQTVVFGASGERLGHVLKSGALWVVKCEGHPVISHHKAAVLAEERLGFMLGIPLTRLE